MQNFLKLIIGCCAMLFISAHAAESLPDLLNNVHTMRSNFVQTVYDNKNKPIQQSYGTMAMKRPGLFRWDVKKPIPQLIVANQTRLWIYDSDLEQVTVRSLKKAAGDTPALLLSHVSGVLEKDYIVQASPKNTPQSQWFTLTPRGADSMFASIKLGFVNNEIAEMRLQDHLGHQTRIQFKDSKANVAIPDNLFVFKAPRGVDVIDETR
jgi:outer membrane lipoprotein carrier protein